MKASIRMGVMTLMVLSIFGGVALADPIAGGGDAGNTFSTASPIVPDVPKGSWTLYNGYVQTTDVDWYKLKTYAGEWLWYDLDQANVYNTLLDIYLSETRTIGGDDTGTVYVNGPSWAKVQFIPGTGHGIDSYYSFRMKRS